MRSFSNSLINTVKKVTTHQLYIQRQKKKKKLYQSSFLNREEIVWYNSWNKSKSTAKVPARRQSSPPCFGTLAGGGCCHRDYILNSNSFYIWWKAEHTSSIPIGRRSNGTASVLHQWVITSATSLIYRLRLSLSQLVIHIQIQSFMFQIF